MADTTATAAAAATEGQTQLDPAQQQQQQQQQQPRGRERMDDNRFCAAEADASYQCLDKNQYDRTKCQDFFTAYRECKKKWVRPRTVACTHAHTETRTCVQPTNLRSTLPRGRARARTPTAPRLAESSTTARRRASALYIVDTLYERSGPIGFTSRTSWLRPERGQPESWWEAHQNGAPR